MAISGIQPSSTSALHQTRADDADEVRQGREAAASQTGKVKAGEEDAVELQSRAAESPELGAARAALRQIDNLDDTRRAEILDKLQSGFYTKPETIAKVAEAMTDALQAGKKTD